MSEKITFPRFEKTYLTALRTDSIKFNKSFIEFPLEGYEEAHYLKNQLLSAIELIAQSHEGDIQTTADKLAYPLLGIVKVLQALDFSHEFEGIARMQEGKK